MKAILIIEKFNNNLSGCHLIIGGTTGFLIKQVAEQIISTEGKDEQDAINNLIKECQNELSILSEAELKKLSDEVENKEWDPTDTNTTLKIYSLYWWYKKQEEEPK